MAPQNPPPQPVRGEYITTRCVLLSTSVKAPGPQMLEVSRVPAHQHIVPLGGRKPNIAPGSHLPAMTSSRPRSSHRVSRSLPFSHGAPRSPLLRSYIILRPSRVNRGSVISMVLHLDTTTSEAPRGDHPRVLAQLLLEQLDHAVDLP